MKNLVLIFAIFTLVFVSCDPKDDNPIVVVDNILSGDIENDSTLDASVEYILNGPLHVVNGGKLRIPAGTVIKAKKGFNKYILVETGGQIFINGTAEKPVTLTSAEATPSTGDWGGLVINGKAILSGATGKVTTSTTEIQPSALYGGNVDNDNSGEITYLKLLYTGAKSSADVEHNGLTLNGVGSGTKIENLFIVSAADDGVEFFGGSVSVKNLLVVNSDDDMFDVTQGWKGTLDNAFGIWEAGYASNESDPRGLELDGNLDGKTPDDINQSNFKFKNITVVNKSTFQMHDAIKLRRGATAEITNILIKGEGDNIKDIIDLVDGAGNGTAASKIDYKVTGATSTKVTNPDGATITVNAANTGADTSVFGWTSYTNF
ncbi:MAG: hypothetical protein JXR27_11260 [Paludibacteraceae bacterium]|nr:hypothetical protein [Paludibacteraceae bacterium]